MNSQGFANHDFKDISKFVITHHAELRMAQRNLSLDDVRFVLQYAQKYHRAGALIFYLRGRDIPEGKQRMLSRLEGTTVIVSREKLCILTVYRNRQTGLRNIKQKPRRSNHRFL